jgi:uncharacterized protein (DUF488 family)
MTLFTIGFAGKSAQQFFETLKNQQVKTLLDSRLHNTSQLAGFTKSRDLPYLLRTIAGIGYRHETLLAPSEELLSNYQKKVNPWSEYEAGYRALLVERKVQEKLSIADLERACLLCTESTPERCHRRLAADYLQCYNPDVDIVHL